MYKKMCYENSIPVASFPEAKGISCTDNLLTFMLID